MTCRESGEIMDKLNDVLLLIEGDVSDAAKVLQGLTKPSQANLEWVASLAEGLQRLKQPGIAAILLNLFLPDSRGIETFEKTLTAAGRIPILVLCGANNESVGRLAVDR